MATDVAAKKGKRDTYANVGFGYVLMSAANTLTFAQIQFAVGIFQGVALLLHRILWYPSNTLCRELVAATDQCEFAITTSNRLSAIVDTSEPAVVALHRFIGIGAGVERFSLPIITDFTQLPGGGKLMPANPVYVGLGSTGFAAAVFLRCVLEFTFLELTSQDYLELIQAQYPANIA